jgi:hypothetical protein
MIGTSMHSVEANVTKYKNGHATCYGGSGVGKRVNKLLAIVIHAVGK